MMPWWPQILELCPLWQDTYLTYRSSRFSSVGWVASCRLPVGALRRAMLVLWAARAGETGPEGGARSQALHPGCLREPVAMATTETVYPALMWLGGQRKWAGYQAFGPPPSSWLYPSRLAHRLWSWARVAGNLRSALPAPAHHSPLGFSRHVCWVFTPTPAGLRRPQNLPAKSGSVIVSGDGGHHP